MTQESQHEERPIAGEAELPPRRRLPTRSATGLTPGVPRSQAPADRAGVRGALVCSPPAPRTQAVCLPAPRVLVTGAAPSTCEVMLQALPPPRAAGENSPTRAEGPGRRSPASPKTAGP